MKEFKAIINAYNEIDFSQRKAALATVVKVQGSSYRSPGARMLITDDGKWVGSISGGCLEGDALRKARQVMNERIPLTVTYDTREESNQNLGIGLGCNGVIHVLIEPIDPSDVNNVIALFKSFTSTQEPLALATTFSASKGVGERILVTGSAVINENFTNTEIELQVKNDLSELFYIKKSETKTYRCNEGSIEVFIELITPSVTLIIFGGGFDARPVSFLAKNLGWDVQVTDECAAHIAPVFFPTADKLSLCHREKTTEQFQITPYTACVLMSHNYEYDRDILRNLLESPAPYIGILGPRKRYEKMIAELGKDGIELNVDDNHRIHSPIGLDIGAETPDEIAVSIIAEIQGKMANRSGGFLKYRSGPIHHRDTNSDQVFKQVFIAQSSKTAVR